MENQAINQELVAALVELQKQLHSHVKMDVKKHYSLIVADSIASAAIANAEGEKVYSPREEVEAYCKDIAAEFALKNDFLASTK